ncbi:conjugal transfer protein TraF [Vibrio cholerae]|uniref:Lipoprotein n=1 Tax=Vibrio cholerae TaxID=666 RepID=A0A7Z7VN35_VIBCL|nr:MULTISPECIES: conjugal transfer protein TraF [Vibrio]MDF4284605.1 conjugal transfer protein TraF [Vibrio parahaemolyticus]EJL6492355.1 conjugal transfer protein TraF [Vibrio cholerae]EJL6644104.1 conjugal transfer protein TraF [Vibrio cholerae]PNV69086.1 hypothetical protein C1Y48_20200 [Vibrio cholerae]TBM40562.1 hypothetical protein EYB64_14105 [Vibrio cholerae]
MINRILPTVLLALTLCSCANNDRVQDNTQNTVEDLELPSEISESWLKDNLNILLERAIDNPTEENVRKYFYAQKVMLDLAKKRAEAVNESQ